MHVSARDDGRVSEQSVPPRGGESTDPADAADAATRTRDHLANERTYLAWLRTAAAVMALGLAIAGLVGRTSATAAILAGSLLIAAGTAGVVYGTVRYRQVAVQIEQGEFAVGTRGPGAIVASSVLIATVVAALLILIIGGH